MKIATVSLDYYTMNNKAKCKTAANDVRKKKFDFAGFTEVRTDAMEEGLREGIGANHTLKMGGESPQAFNHKRWKMTGFRIVDGNKGVADITPNLKFTVVTYQNRKTPRKVIEVVSTHFVPLTQDGNPRPNYNKRWSMWQEMWGILKTIIAEAQQKNHTIFVIGDFNHIKAKKNIIKQLDSKAKWIVHAGLDWIFVVEGATKVRRLQPTINFGSGSDHKAHIRTVILA